MLARDFLRGVASTCVSGRLWTFHLRHQYLYAVSEGHMCVYDSYSLRDNSLFACVDGHTTRSRALARWIHV